MTSQLIHTGLTCILDLSSIAYSRRIPLLLRIGLRHGLFYK